MNGPVNGVKCIAFDLDGTLLDIGGIFYRVFDTLLPRLGLEPIRFTEERGPWKSSIRQATAVYPHVAGHVGGPAFMDAWEEVLRAMLAEGTMRLHEGSVDTLRRLQAAGTKLCLATNTPRRFVDIKLAWFDLRGYFEYVFTPQDRWGSKPRPDSLLHALDALGLSPAEAMMVGDHDVDVQYARNAGVRAVAVLNGGGSEEELIAAEPDIMLPSVAAVPELVLGGTDT